MLPWRCILQLLMFHHHVFPYFTMYLSTPILHHVPQYSHTSPCTSVFPYFTMYLSTPILHHVPQYSHTSPCTSVLPYFTMYLCCMYVQTRPHILSSLGTPLIELLPTYAEFHKYIRRSLHTLYVHCIYVLISSIIRIIKNLIKIPLCWIIAIPRI